MNKVKRAWWHFRPLSSVLLIVILSTSSHSVLANLISDPTFNEPFEYRHTISSSNLIYEYEPQETTTDRNAKLDEFLTPYLSIFSVDGAKNGLHGELVFAHSHDGPPNLNRDIKINVYAEYPANVRGGFRTVMLGTISSLGRGETKSVKISEYADEIPAGVEFRIAVSAHPGNTRDVMHNIRLVSGHISRRPKSPWTAQAGAYAPLMNVYTREVKTTYCNRYTCPGRVYRTLACMGGFGWALAQYNIDSLKPNSRYRLSVTPVADPESNGPAGDLQVRILDASGHNFQYAELAPSASGSVGYDIVNGRQSIEFVTPKNHASQSASVHFGVTSSQDAGHQSVCLSNIQLEEVQAPKVDTNTPKVAVNSHGYVYDLPRLATVANLPGNLSDYQWHLTYKGNRILGYGYRGSTIRYNGDLQPVRGSDFQLDVDSGDRTAIIDFSGHNSYWTPPSTTDQDYRLQVVRKSDNSVVVTSDKFAMHSGEVIHGPLKADVLNALYQQRSGQRVSPKRETAINQHSPFEESRGYSAFNEYNFYNRDGHIQDYATCFEGNDKHGNYWPGCPGVELNVAGGWYDAADHGKYVVNGALSVWTLLNMYERLERNDTPSPEEAFPDNLLRQGINGVSDLLDEARHEMEFLMAMQAPQGTTMEVPVGYQANKQTSPGEVGIYQIDAQGNHIGSNARGDIAFGNGTLPRLQIKLELTPTDVSGMAFHAVHDRCWTGLPQDPTSYSVNCEGQLPGGGFFDDNDSGKRVLMYPTTAATLNLAAAGAQCYRVWRDIDSAFAMRCLDSALKAFGAAKRLRENGGRDIFRYEFSNGDWSHADPSGKNGGKVKDGFAVTPNFAGGGNYGDLRVGDEFYWAGMELYLAIMRTPVRHQAQQFLDYGARQVDVNGEDDHGAWSTCEDDGILPIECYNWVSGWDWQNVATLGTISAYTTIPNQIIQNGLAADGANVTGAEAVRMLTNFADSLVGFSEKQGYGLAQEPGDEYEWGANASLLSRSIIMATAADVVTRMGDTEKASSYRKAIVQSMDYILGRNALKRSYVSGYGDNAMAKPHHRFFAKHVNINYAPIPPGFLAGGPNSRDFAAIMANATLDNGKLTKQSDYSAHYYLNTTLNQCLSSSQGAKFTYYGQRCYNDHSDSFATNEIAINWQAPLLWVSQYLSEF